MNTLALIPARMGSSRFPGKPLVPILGKPMLGHVYDSVRTCGLLRDTVVATCDEEIVQYVESIGGRAVMTSDQHERASDRCAEALATLEKEDGITYDFVVMVQGDEPMIHPDMIEEAMRPLLNDPSVQVSNLLGRITSEAEFQDRNCIKVVCDLKGDALYFSREPIPTRSRGVDTPWGKQVCVIPFRRDYLLKYVSLEPTPLEIAESVDMMRCLEHGDRVRLVPTLHDSHAVDTPEDVAVVERALQAMAAGEVHSG